MAPPVAGYCCSVQVRPIRRARGLRASALVPLTDTAHLWHHRTAAAALTGRSPVGLPGNLPSVLDPNAGECPFEGATAASGAGTPSS